jgi:PD-(D/E)XK endonuclease
MLTSDQKGAIAETAIIHAAIKLGLNVYRPVVEGGRYDMIFEAGSNLLRIQCKWSPRHGDVVALRCYSARRNRNGLLTRLYAEGEIDAFAAYCPELDRCYFLPFELFAGRSQVHLRLGPCRNNQKLGINWAKDFEFAATLGPHGAIAQLGERLAGSQKVAGSSPAGSIL